MARISIGWLCDNFLCMIENADGFEIFPMIEAWKWTWIRVVIHLLMWSGAQNIGRLEIKDLPISIPRFFNMDWGLHVWYRLSLACLQELNWDKTHAHSCISLLKCMCKISIQTNYEVLLCTVSGQLSIRTIPHRTSGIGPNEWFYWMVVVPVGS